MKLIFVFAGVVLLVTGLLAYATIPNVHTFPVESSSALAGLTKILVNPNFVAETRQNVTLIPNKANEMVINVSVTSPSGAPSSIEFKLFTSSEVVNCTRDYGSTRCIIDESVTNQTIRVPLNASTTYYFQFENRDPNTPRDVALSALLVGSSTTSIVARDGELNFAALVVGFLGLLVVAYGIIAKTVIPWE